VLNRRRLIAASVSLAAAPTLRAQGPRVLRFAWWGGAARHAATLKAIALFESLHPGVKVKAEYMGFNGYLERLTAQIAGGSEPDVMQINWAWLAMFSKRGNGFADLDAHSTALALDQFTAQDLSMGRVTGKLNALPASYTARVLLWNQTAFARAGLSLPRTWDDLFACGPLFGARLGQDHFPLDGELYDMLLLAQAHVHQATGQSYVSATRPAVAMSVAAAKLWVQTYRRLIAQHVATPLQLRASLGGADKATEQQLDWTVGRWAGNYTWDSVIALRASTLRKDQTLAIGEFPTLPQAANSGMFGRPTLMFAVGRRSLQADLAARLVGFLLTSEAAARVLGRTRGMPAARAPFELMQREGQWPALELKAHQQIKAQRDAGRIERPHPLFEHARLHRFMREVFETVAYDKTTDDAAASRLVDEGNALLRRIA